MQFQAGFSETDITPESFPARTYWAPTNFAMDPLFAHAAVFHDGTRTVALLSLDVVIVEREYVLEIRKRVARECPIPPDHIMVCATHNHACPAVVKRPWSDKDDRYIEHMIQQAAEAVIEAYRAMVPAEIGVGTCYEGRISFNRRFIMKNGSVISQPPFNILDRDVLYGEGIIDPQVGVLCARNTESGSIGMLVNFGCHAVHHMGSLSAGFPGVLCNRLKNTYGQDFVCVFLNGPCGNVIHRNYADPEQEDTMERVGSILADDVIRASMDISYSGKIDIATESRNLNIRYRELDGLERNIDNLDSFNVFKGLIEKGWYKWSLKKLRELHSKSDHEEAEIQVMRIGDTLFGSVPAEYFSQYSISIKERSPVEHTFVVSLANGWLGYIPHHEAFDRIGGHESTWCFSSKMKHDAGNLVADTMLELMRSVST